MLGALSGLGLILIAFLILARKVHPAPNQEGVGFTDDQNRASKSTSQATDLSVATFNIQTGKSLQGKRDIRRAASALANVQLAAVQEVYGAGWLNKLGIGQSQSQALAKVNACAYLFAATRYRWLREQRGNTTLSQLAITAWRVVMLPDQSRKSPRNMTIAHFEWQGQNAVLINTHLHTGRGREQQLQVVIEEFLRHPSAILAGDFNTTVSDPQIQNLLNNETVTDAIAAAGLTGEGEQRIDWILTRGFSVVDGEEYPKGISDHPYYQVNLN